MLLIALVAGFAVFIASLFVMLKMDRLHRLPLPATISDSSTAAEKTDAINSQEAINKAKTYRNFGYFVMVVGVVTLIVVAVCQAESIKGTLVGWIANTRKMASLQWASLFAWTAPGLYLAAVLFLTPDSQSVNNDSRTKYLDAVKTLITAAGLTIGIVISTSLKPDHAPPGWTDTVREGVLALAISISCSVVTLFLLSLLYDRAEARSVKRKELLLVIPFTYFALVKFLLGFIYMVRLTFLLKS